MIATAGLGGHVYRSGIASVTCPVLLIHGERDRLVPVSAARAAARAHPSWSLFVLPDVGHVPQLEAPRDCAAAIFSWLDASGRPVAQSATTATPTLFLATAVQQLRTCLHRASSIAAATVAATPGLSPSNQ